MIKVRLPSALVAAADVQGDDFKADGATVGEVFRSLSEAYVGLKPYFFNAAGVLKDHPWSIFLNGAQADINAPVVAGDEIEVIAGMSGGVDTASFAPAEVRRYARHLTLPQVGRAGQGRLKNARVLVVGAGGLGSPVALYLAAAGVGCIRIVDADVVEESNLQRQVLHDMDWLGKPKVDSARDRLQKLNPHIDIEAVRAAVDEDNARDLVADCDVVVDGTDNFATRLLLNRETRRAGVPLVFGAVFQFSGHVAVFNDRPDAACYQCVFPRLPTGDLAPNCAVGGVIGVVPGVVGMMQANEAVKLILGLGKPLSGRLLAYDALDGVSRELRFARAQNCPGCSASAIAEDARVGVCIAEAQSASPLRAEQVLAPAALARLIAEPNAPSLIDVREPGELEICRLDGAINLPVGKLAKSLSVLDPSVDYVVFCRSGVRSARAVAILEAAGFSSVRHLDGGLLRWSREVDLDIVVV